MSRYVWKLIITFYYQNLSEKSNILHFGYVFTFNEFSDIDVKNHKQCTRKGFLSDKMEKFKLGFKNLQSNALRILHICYWVRRMGSKIHHLLNKVKSMSWQLRQETPNLNNMGLYILSYVYDMNMISFDAQFYNHRKCLLITLAVVVPVSLVRARFFFHKWKTASHEDPYFDPPYLWLMISLIRVENSTIRCER